MTEMVKKISFVDNVKLAQSIYYQKNIRPDVSGWQVHGHTICLHCKWSEGPDGLFLKEHDIYGNPVGIAELCGAGVKWELTNYEHRCPPGEICLYWKYRLDKLEEYVDNITGK